MPKPVLAELAAELDTHAARLAGVHDILARMSDNAEANALGVGRDVVDDINTALGEIAGKLASTT